MYVEKLVNLNSIKLSRMKYQKTEAVYACLSRMDIFYFIKLEL